MAAGLLAISAYTPARDRQGRLVPGARMDVFANRTTTRAVVYADAALTTPLPNPIIANASGQFPSVWAPGDGDANPLFYTLSYSGADGSSIGNPSTFDDIQPSVSLDLVDAGSKVNLTGDNVADPNVFRENVGIVRVSLIDFIDNPAVKIATLANTNRTVSLSNAIEAALAALPVQGGDLMVPPVTLPISRGVAVGDGTATSVSTRNGVRIVAEGPRGTDDGTFGGGQPGQAARFLYIGPQADSLSLFRVAGPIWGAACLGVVWDCNGKAGRPWELINVIEGDFWMTGQKYRTDQGRAVVWDAPLPFGVTLGFFKTRLRLRTVLPSWDGVTVKRGLGPHYYSGGPINNIGFSLNELECEHVFDDAGTAAWQDTYIDNNRGQIWSRTSTGTSPYEDPTLAGVGRRRIIRTDQASPIGENRIYGNPGGGWITVNQFGVAVTGGEADFVSPWPLNDYEPVPSGKLVKGWTAKGRGIGGMTGSLVTWPWRSQGNIGAGTVYYSPIGESPAGADRFAEQNGPGVTTEVWRFIVNLGGAPGAGASRTFTLLQNGVDTAVTLSFGPTENGRKALQLSSPLLSPPGAEWSIRATQTGAPGASPVFGLIGHCPLDEII